jgi:hypothetical protein
LRFKLSYRELAELARELGVSVAPSTVLRCSSQVCLVTFNAQRHDEAQTRQGASLDAYLFLACQQPAALKSRIELPPGNYILTVSFSGERYVLEISFRALRHVADL